MGFPRLHLLDRDNWAVLLPDLRPNATALDVGAGSGYLLHEFAPLFREVVATEMSRAMVWRLGRQGVRAHQTSVIKREFLGQHWGTPDLNPEDFEGIEILDGEELRRIVSSGGS